MTPGGARPYSALDMSGNVVRWGADRYESEYYSESPCMDPTGPHTGTHKVVRGGAWLDQDDNVRAVRRGDVDPVTASDILGFRCVTLHRQNRALAV